MQSDASWSLPRRIGISSCLTGNQAHFDGPICIRGVNKPQQDVADALIENAAHSATCTAFTIPSGGRGS